MFIKGQGRRAPFCLLWFGGYSVRGGSLTGAERYVISIAQHSRQAGGGYTCGQVDGMGDISYSLDRWNVNNNNGWAIYGVFY